MTHLTQCSKTEMTCTHKFREALINMYLLKVSIYYYVGKAAISGLEATTSDFHQRGLGSIPCKGNGFLFFFKTLFLWRFCDSQQS